MSWLGRFKPVIRFKPRLRPLIAISLHRGRPRITISPIRVEPVVRAKPRVGPWFGKWFKKK